MNDTIGTVGKCIYCGATSYVPNSDEPVHDEHIIPEGLSGNYVLRQASCRSCERKINPWETKLLRGALYPYKIHLDLKSKKPKEKATQLLLFDRATNQKVMVAIADMPVILHLPAFPTPALLTKSKSVLGPWRMWMHMFVPPKYDLLRQKYGLNGFATGSIDTFALCRTLAKIAHCVASVYPGIDAFEPFLPKYILGDNDTERFTFVGGLVGETPEPTQFLHQTEIEAPPADQPDLIVVRIQLFAPLGAPVYRVVVGRRVPGAAAAAKPVRPNRPFHEAPDPGPGLTVDTPLPFGELPRYLRADASPPAPQFNVPPG